MIKNSYRTLVSTKATPQNEPVLGKTQVKNRAGGFVFQTDKWDQLDRFLILGSDTNTYYASAKTLTKENASSALVCIKEDGKRVVDRVVEISEAGRAPKNDPALFILAMCAGEGDLETRQYALKSLSKVARIGTHLFHFAEYVEGFRGWGRTLKKAIAAWYNEKDLDRVVFQVMKYGQRDGWSHRDLFRLSHPHTNDVERSAVYRWIVSGTEGLKERKIGRNGKERVYADVSEHLHEGLKAFEALRSAKDEKDIINLIKEHGMPWETVPREWLGSAKVWESILPRLPVTATLRNLGRLTANGLLSPLGEHVDTVVSRLTDEIAVAKSRVHPLSVLMAMKTYEQGQGDRGKLTWSPVSQIVDALDSMFYIAFKSVEPTNKRILLALDVSGSMGMSEIAGMRGITPRVGSAAMALVTAATEKKCHIFGFSDRFIPLTISPQMRLDSVIRDISGLPFMGTDCSLPMKYALQKSISVDCFVIYTDNETWAGYDMHPFQALLQYRKTMNIDSKLVVVGMTSNSFTIADPSDAGMLDCVGFDVAVPNIISNFIVGK